MKVSIICPTFNGDDLLKKSLNAILNQKFDQPYEIIFVDSSSNDGTAEHLNYQSEIHEHLHLYNINQSEFEHGKTRNFAISKSSGELIVLLTQDAIPANDYWLATMVDTLENKDIAGVFGRHIAHKDHPKLIQRDLDIHFNRMNETPIRKIEDWNTYKNDTTLRQLLHFFSNNNSGLKRNIWEKIPFPEVDYGEDQTWAKKIIEKGYSLAYQHNSIVHHSHNFSYKEWTDRLVVENEFFKTYFNYNLQISHKKPVRRFLLNLSKDFKYLTKTNSLNLFDFKFSLKKNYILNFSKKISFVCPYDQHIWVFENKRQWLSKKTAWGLSKSKLIRLMKRKHSQFTRVDEIKNLNVADELLIKAVREYSIIDEVENDIKKIRHKICHNPSIARKINFPIKIPNDSIHRMQRTNPDWIGDFYSANLFLDVLHEVGLKIETNKRYLDFGCSSGSLLRVLNWCYPNACWHGTDPVKNSIDWASKNLKDICFTSNSKCPPTIFNKESMDGVVSISVWSHFGAGSAKIWLNEMHRILKPQGWLLVTFHGLRSLYHNINDIEKPSSRWCAIYDGLKSNNFVFEEVWIDNDDAGNSSEDWGNSYIKLTWWKKNIENKFKILLFKRGINQKNQDVIMLRKI